MVVPNILVSLDEAAHICSVDNVHGLREFVSDNKYQCRHACNTWLTLGRDLGLPYDILWTLRDVVVTAGLARTVATSVALAEELLEGLGKSEIEGVDGCHKWALSHQHDRTLTLPFTEAADYFCCNRDNETEICACILQFFLYLERYTYIDKAQDAATYRKFFGINDRCRDIYYSWPYSSDSEGVDTPDPAFVWPGPSVLCLVQRELSEIFVKEKWSFNPLDRTFSSGANYDAGRDYAKKWEEIAKYYPGYKCLRDCRLPVRDTNHKLPDNRPHLLAVPKTMASKRIIAPENVISSWNSSSVLGALRRMNSLTGNSKFINEEDQSVNDELAKAGSANGSWATIDMSGASDSISKALFFRCIPDEFSYVYQCLTSSWIDYEVDGETRTRKLFSLLTSGNRVTWLTEAMWFLAIARAGVHLCGLKNAHQVCFAYGDDLIVPAECYETVCELLEALGHVVNRRKSYGFGVFRESCGGWYHRGTNVTPCFWPRRVVTRSDQEEVLCHLQHKFWAFEATRTYCEDTVLGLNKSMTLSPVGDECDDLWSLDVRPVLSDGWRHWHPRVATTPHKRTALIEAVTYYEYLEYGPLYMGGLEELLKVSSSRLDRYDIR